MENVRLITDSLESESLTTRDRQVSRDRASPRDRVRPRDRDSGRRLGGRQYEPTR